MSNFRHLKYFLKKYRRSRNRDFHVLQYNPLKIGQNENRPKIKFKTVSKVILAAEHAKFTRNIIWSQIEVHMTNFILGSYTFYTKIFINRIFQFGNRLTSSSRAPKPVLT